MLSRRQPPLGAGEGWRGRRCGVQVARGGGPRTAAIAVALTPTAVNGEIDRTAGDLTRANRPRESRR